MVRQSLLFTFSLAIALTSFGQEEVQDSVVRTRTIIPSIYIDYGKILTLPYDQETKVEGGFELLFFEKFPLIVEVGQGTLTPDGALANGTYESQGLYYRVGAGYYSQFKPKNKVGISVRYAAANFSETGRTVLSSPSKSQDNYIGQIDRENLQAQWYEVVWYSDRTLTDIFTVGLNIRFRILASYNEQSPLDVYSIPGYGRAFENTIPAVNFFLKVSF